MDEATVERRGFPIVVVGKKATVMTGGSHLPASEGRRKAACAGAGERSLMARGG